MEYEKLKGIRVSEYEYPGEANAFAVVKKIPGMDKILAAYMAYLSKLYSLPEVLGDCFRVTEDTSPAVYKIYKKALQRLDMPEEYPLYAKSEYEYNAYTTGGSSPYVVIYSSMLKNLSEEELLFVLGHELGHVKSGHVIYYTMAQQINTLISALPVPGVDLASVGIQFALIDWARMHEYTADRAGVLAAGSIEGGQRGLGILLGVDEKLKDIHIDVEDLLAQNAAFEETKQNWIGKMISAGGILLSDHPWTVSRIQKLEEWKNSGDYSKVLERDNGPIFNIP